MEFREIVLPIIKTPSNVLQCVQVQFKSILISFLVVFFVGVQCESNWLQFKTLTAVMIYPEPSAATSGERSSAPGFGCCAEARFLPPSGWEVWVRHWVRVVH